VSAVKRIEFVSDRMPYIVRRRLWIVIIVLTEQAGVEVKSDDSKDKFVRN
jgi:hypothetical protein